MVSQLASILSTVVTQELVPKADGSGRIAATEVLVNTKAVSNLIRERKISQINTSIQSGGSYGMHSLNSSLIDMVNQRIITKEAALNHSNNPDELRKLLNV